ncbi:MAG: glycosyltransferase family 2 protein [Patescibacteria group bacterium]
MKKPVKITTVIVTYNNQKSIDKCLSSLVFNQNPDTLQNKIIVVDNHSKDQTVEFVKQKYASRVKIMRNNSNRGFASAINQVIQKEIKGRKPDCFFLLNPDAWLEKNCLPLLIKEFIERNSSDIISPVIKNQNKKVVFQGGKIKWLNFKAVHCFSENCNLDYITGASMLLKSDVFSNIGFFDERFFLYYEDVDFCRRAKKAGFKMKIIKKAITYHNESQSSSSKTKNYYLVKSGALFFYKHSPFLLKPYFWLIFYLRLLYHSFSGKKEVKKGLIKALKQIQQQKD